MTFEALGNARPLSPGHGRVAPTVSTQTPILGLMPLLTVCITYRIIPYPFFKVPTFLYRRS